MIVLRKFLVLLMFSAFLVGCTTPLIDIDVKHSAGGAPGSGGSGCEPWQIAWGCISGGGASLPLVGKVTKVETFTNAADAIKVYSVDVGGAPRRLHVPPWTVIDDDDPIEGDDVEVTYTTGKIRKVVP